MPKVSDTRRVREGGTREGLRPLKRDQSIRPPERRQGDQQFPAQQQRAKLQGLQEVRRNAANGSDLTRYAITLSERAGDLEAVRSFLRLPSTLRDAVMDMHMEGRVPPQLEALGNRQKIRILQGAGIIAEQRALATDIRSRHTADETIEILQSPERLQREVMQSAAEHAQRSTIRLSEAQTTALRSVLNLSEALRNQVIETGARPNAQELAQAGITDERTIATLSEGADLLARMSPEQRAALEHIHNQHLAQEAITPEVAAQETIATVQSPELIRRALLSIDLREQVDSFLASLHRFESLDVQNVVAEAEVVHGERMLRALASLPAEERAALLQDATQLTPDQATELARKLMTQVGTVEPTTRLEQFADTLYYQWMQSDSPARHGAEAQDIHRDSVVYEMDLLYRAAEALNGAALQVPFYDDIAYTQSLVVNGTEAVLARTPDGQFELRATQEGAPPYGAARGVALADRFLVDENISDIPITGNIHTIRFGNGETVTLAKGTAPEFFLTDKGPIVVVQTSPDHWEGRFLDGTRHSDLRTVIGDRIVHAPAPPSWNEATAREFEATARALLAHSEAERPDRERVLSVLARMTPAEQAQLFTEIAQRSPEVFARLQDTLPEMLEAGTTPTNRIEQFAWQLYQQHVLTNNDLGVENAINAQSTTSLPDSTIDQPRIDSVRRGMDMLKSLADDWRTMHEPD